MEWEELTAQLATAGLANVATADTAGRPHASVVSAVVDADDLVFFTRRTSGKGRNLAVNPRISMMWRPRGEIYLQGDVEVVDDVAEKGRIWTSGLLPYDPASFFGAADDPDIVLVRVHPTRATVMMAGASGLERHTWTR